MMAANPAQASRDAPVVRTARKVWRCVNAHACERGNPTVANCRITIHPGERYTEGDIDPYLAGGFGHDKLCTACAPIQPPALRANPAQVAREHPLAAKYGPDWRTVLGIVDYPFADHDETAFCDLFPDYLPAGQDERSFVGMVRS